MSDLVYNEVPTAFPWYDKLEKQDRFRRNVLAGCYFQLISPKNAMLPFLFRKPKTPEPPLKWEVLTLDGDPVIDISNNLALIKGKSLQGMDYIYYGGGQLTFNRVVSADVTTPEPLNLPNGYYYSRLTFKSTSYYSEVFYIPGPAKAFVVGDQINTAYLCLTWYNKSDMEPFYYADQVAGVPVFKNVLYIDTFTTNSEPEIVEEGDKDAAGNVIPDFQQAVIKYRMSMIVPDFLKLALVLIQMHSNKFLQERFNVRSGEMLRVASNTGLEANGAMSTVDLLYEQDLAISRVGCNNNMLIDGIGGLGPFLNPAVMVGGRLKISGNTTPDAWVYLYASNAENGSYTKMAGPYTSAQMAAGVLFNANEYLGKSWFYVNASNWNYNYGDSNKVQKPA